MAPLVAAVVEALEALLVPAQRQPHPSKPAGCLDLSLEQVLAMAALAKRRSTSSPSVRDKVVVLEALVLEFLRSGAAAI